MTKRGKVEKNDRGRPARVIENGECSRADDRRVPQERDRMLHGCYTDATRMLHGCYTAVFTLEND